MAGYRQRYQARLHPLYDWLKSTCVSDIIYEVHKRLSIDLMPVYVHTFAGTYVNTVAC